MESQRVYLGWFAQKEETKTPFLRLRLLIPFHVRPEGNMLPPHPWYWCRNDRVGGRMLVGGKDPGAERRGGGRTAGLSPAPPPGSCDLGQAGHLPCAPAGPSVRRGRPQAILRGLSEPKIMYVECPEGHLLTQRTVNLGCALSPTMISRGARSEWLEWPQRRLRPRVASLQWGRGSRSVELLLPACA